MKVEIENTPIVDRDSWVGKAIELTGAKTWCSLVARGGFVLTLLAMWVGGLIMMSTGYFETNFFTVIWGALTIIGCIIAVIGMIMLTGFAVENFNCWAQNKCTPIFKDD